VEKFGIGQGVLREEDPRLLRGKGLFVSDVELPGQTHAVVLRSPHAHADILGIDISAAAGLPGVLAIYTGEDIAADNLGVPGMPAKWLRPDGQPMKYRPQPTLALGRVRYVGDPVALIVAETLDQATDAAETVMVDYAPLPSITDTAQTVQSDAPLVWDDYPDNVSAAVVVTSKKVTGASPLAASTSSRRSARAPSPIRLPASRIRSLKRQRCGEA
jgi:carbon-monoxide dehydrogenase large subunit